MTGPDGVAVTESIAAAAGNAGLAMIFAAFVVRGLYLRWHRTEAVHVVEGGLHRLRWHGRRHMHEVSYEPTGPAPAVGAVVPLWFHAGDPSRWSLTAPYRGARALAAAGAVLAAAGLLLGFVLP
ncbi:hypothetical protein V5H98_01595 [Georgenia sp. M64]|uniref:hypothetical protein n=1 Tax=Georgenia sp. M64 TaxID=3120520 RepID=UPI0030E0E81A